MTATSTEVTLSPKTKAILHQSILNYLHRSGFTKTLKRFQSEAQIQNDTWKTSSANLEDIYCKYINDSCQPKDNVVETKAKKKKKNKQDLASVDDDIVNGLEVKESKKKTKDKKKSVEENEDVDAKKSSKKRKRLLSDENGHQTVEEVPKQNDSNEKLEINGVEKSVKKQRVGSAEPKTVNAFQRVKIDQVEFAHEKLQDNSYWAKDGADVGYGAKAQEVLGQVRGRGFRHEKTKKKRGSYRGGQIDLQSHSVKFNYSDEE